MVTSQGQSLFNAGDLCHHHVIVTERPRSFSSTPTGSRARPRGCKAFDMLASNRIPMLSYHFPWPGVGFVGKPGDAYRSCPPPSMRTVL